MNETPILQTPDNTPKKQGIISLRTKILVGNLLIVLLTVAAMGYFVFYRSQITNKFIIDQFDISVNREIENRLTGIVSNEVNDITIFFSSMKNVISTFGTTAGALLSNNSSINLDKTNWNPYVEMNQLPNGSWDNPNDELASIFIPANVLMRDNLATELSALKGLDFFVKGLMEKNPEIIAIYFGGEAGETVYYPNVDLATLLPPDFNVATRPWYVNAVGISPTDEKTVWSTPYQDAALNGLVITSSTSVFTDSGSFRGVAGLDVKLDTITNRVSTLKVEKTGYGFLIDSKGRIIALPSQGFKDFNITEEDINNSDIENLSVINRVPLDLFQVLAKMTSGQTGVRLVNINGANHYIAYKPVPIVGYSFGVVVSEDELLQEFVETNATLGDESRKIIIYATGMIFILLSVAGLASYGIGNSITAPLEKLTGIAKKIAAGNLDETFEVTTRDEIGILGNTLNNMSATAKRLVTNLEDLIIERTRVIERRIAQIQAVAEVGKAVASQRDLDELLTLTTHLISSRFGFYHVGIFLLDPRKEYAVLMAANSSGGKKMLEREHKLRIGAVGIVGAVAGSGEARIALDVGTDAIYFDNPDLPQTRSEMALPLIAGAEIQGVLDVQSLEANAFTAEDIPTLQILADQLAIAVQNARMIRDTHEALFAARKATGEVSQQGWREMLGNITTVGYVGRAHGEVAPAIKKIDDKTKKTLNSGTYLTSNNNRTLSIPVIVRGQTIGMIRLTKPTHAEPWKLEEIGEMESLSDQLSSTLESARLYKEAQQRAAREQMISEITSSITASTEVEDIIRKTVTQLGKTFQDADITLRVNPRLD